MKTFFIILFSIVVGFIFADYLQTKRLPFKKEYERVSMYYEIERCEKKFNTQCYMTPFLDSYNKTYYYRITPKL